jgi:hypothetical protein
VLWLTCHACLQQRIILASISASVDENVKRERQAFVWLGLHERRILSHPVMHWPVLPQAPTWSDVPVCILHVMHFTLACPLVGTDQKRQWQMAFSPFLALTRGARWCAGGATGNSWSTQLVEAAGGAWLLRSWAGYQKHRSPCRPSQLAQRC